MDINALRVFNSMHKLEITEKEFEDIEREQNEESNTGLYIACVKREYSICVSHDQRHQIIVKRIFGKTNKELPISPSRVLFKTLTTVVDLPQEIYTLHAIAQYRALDSEIKFVALKLEELKDRVMGRFVDKYPKELGDLYQDMYGGYDEREKNKKRKGELVVEQLKALFWLFGDDYKKFEKEVKYARPNVPRIIKAFQRNNRRVAIIQESEDYDKTRGGGMGYGGMYQEHIERTTLKIITFTPRNPRYNYCSPNRELYLPSQYADRGEIWIDDDLFEKVSKEELAVLSKRMSDDDNDERTWKLLTANEFNNMQSAIRLEMMSEKRKAVQEVAKKKLVKSIEKQFENGTVVRQGITITKKGMEYEGVNFKGSKFGEYIVGQQIHLQDQPEFDKIVEGYIGWVLNISVNHDLSWQVSGETLEFKGKEEMQIGKIKVLVESRGHNIYINKFRIAKDDVRLVLLRAMQYKDQKKYDEWLMHTGRVNLRLQDTLSKGSISFELKIDNTDDNDLPFKDYSTMLLAMAIRRDGHKTYIAIRDNEYRVQNHSALFDLGKDIDSCRLGQSGGGYLQRTIKLLYRALNGITHKEIGLIIADGEKEYSKLQRKLKKEEAGKIRKSRVFLDHAIKLTKAVKISGGYKVRGDSGTFYTIDFENLGINKIVKGKKEYLCIIDMGSDTDNKWGKNDAIAKRLLMLSKDIKVASEIYDMGDKMDKHWLEIMEEKIEVEA